MVRCHECRAALRAPLQGSRRPWPRVGRLRPGDVSSRASESVANLLDRAVRRHALRQVRGRVPARLRDDRGRGYLATKTPAERERLLKPENAKRYAKGWKDDFITGPGGENVCNNQSRS